MSRVTKDSAAHELHADAIYRSPTNRLCRWQPGQRDDEELHFTYCSANGVQDKSHNADGFTLSRSRLVVLRRVG